MIMNVCLVMVVSSDVIFVAVPMSVTEGQSPGLVSVDGGRYDVNVEQRVRRSVYWDETDTHVRRCSWFYRSDTDNRMVPYDEEFASRLEVHS